MAKKKSKQENEEKELQEELDEDIEEEDDDEEGSGLFSNPKVIYSVIILAIVGFVLWQVKGYFVAAMVNNSPITRLELVKELESTYGAQILDTMITREIVIQAAEEQGITASEEEIDQQVAEIRGTIEQQGSTLEDELATRGQTEENLREGVRYTILVEKLFKDEIDISEEDVREYYEQNQELYGQADFEDIQTQLREQMIQQQLSGQFNEWLQNQREQANVRRFVDF